MRGYILYSKADADKNKAYIDMHIDKFKKVGIELELIIIEEKQNMEVPDFVINRSRNYKVAQSFEEKGARVFNSSKVTEIANNKGKTYNYLKDIVPFMPVSYRGKSIKSQVNTETEKIEYPYVMKSCSGHGGSQVFMVNSDTEKEEALQAMGNDEYIIQQCCSDLGRDVRIYIVGNEIVAAMLRTSANSFKSNYSLGGNVERYELNDLEKSYVNKIVEKLPLDFAAIDFTFHNNNAVFNEIEDAAGSRMLYANTDIDIVELQVKYILSKLK